MKRDLRRNVEDYLVFSLLSKTRKSKMKGEKRGGIRSMGNNSNNFGDCTGGGATHSHDSSGGTEHMV